MKLELNEHSDSVDTKARSMIYIYRHILNDYVVMRRGKRIALGIEPLEIEKWLQALRRENGLANPTLDKTRRVMSLVYKHSQRHGLIPRGEECNPLRFVRCKSTSDYEAIILTSGQAFSMLLCLSERLTNYGSHPEWPTTSSHNLCATVEEWAFRPASAQENIECRPEGRFFHAAVPHHQARAGSKGLLCKYCTPSCVRIPARDHLQISTLVFNGPRRVAV